MNVIMLTWEYPPHLVGGLARAVHALAKALAKQGHKVHVMTRAGGGLPPDAMEDGVHVVRVPLYFQEPQDFRLWVTHLNFALMEAGTNLLSELEQPAVLHAHDWLVAYAAKGLKNLFRIPLVSTIHATEHGRHQGIWDGGQQYINDVEWWLTYESWRVIVCSQAMRAEVRGLFGLGDDKVVVLPNGVEMKEPGAYENLPTREQWVARDERLLFHMGRIVPEKGLGVLLEALPKVLAHQNVKTVVAGTGPYLDEAKRRVRALGLGDRVYFLGRVSDRTADALYRSADVAVVPSTYEPFGIVALEAMAAGTPLIVSDTGGLGEIVWHDGNGLKAYPGNAHSLADQILRMLTEPGLAQRLSAQARRDVEQFYTWDGIAERTAELYENVILESAQTDWSAIRLHHMAPPASASGEAPGRYTI